jgi:hypothetical protein
LIVNQISGLIVIKEKEKALDVYVAMNDDLVNKVMEVRADGSVHVREWNADDHDIGHINNPKWP